VYIEASILQRESAMKADQSRHVGLIEVTTHSISDLRVELRDIVGLRKNVGSDGSGEVTALRGFFNEKVNFGRIAIDLSG
jgi:hypothetical protein